MIACLRVPGLPLAAVPLDGLMELLAGLTPHVEAEGPLVLRADARRRRAPYSLPPAQLDEQQAATCYADLGKLTVEDALSAAHTVHRLLAAHFELPVALGLAAGRFTARVAAIALRPGEHAVVTPGEEARFLAPFPTNLLPVDGETLRQLHLLGLRQLGQIAALPSAALLERFGRQGPLMHRLASGRDTSRVARYAPPVVLEARRQFEWAVDAQPVLAAALDTLAGELAGRLARAGHTAGRVTLSLNLEDCATVERTLALRQPSASRAHLLAALEELLGALPITRGVEAVRVALGGVRQPVARQLSLFEREPVSQARLREVLGDLVARHGECFYRAVVLDEDARLLKRRVGFEKLDVA